MQRHALPGLGVAATCNAFITEGRLAPPSPMCRTTKELGSYNGTVPQFSCRSSFEITKNPASMLAGFWRCVTRGLAEQVLDGGAFFA